MDPVKVIVASPEPVPFVKLSPAVPASDTTPLVAASVTSTGLLPASASDTESHSLPTAPACRLRRTVCGAGTLLTGATLAGTADAGAR